MATGSPELVPLGPIQGVRLASVAAGIKYSGRRDLVLFELAPGTTTVGMFTRNAFCAAPVQLARQHLAGGDIRYLLINTGNANAGTGPVGLADALDCCEALALTAGVNPAQVLPFSTGVIGQRLPAQRIIDAIPAALGALNPTDWLGAATGIMTTDTRPKAHTRTVTLGDHTITITGIAKGAGMIKPNMATMLSFIFTDAGAGPELLEHLLQGAVQRSFNRITVDGDTSTNDSCILAATGASGVTLAQCDAGQQARFAETLNAVLQWLAIAIIRDAEGASKFVTVTVRNGVTSDECLAVAYAIAESPLVKTALFASDPNWGRILAAVGRAGLERLDIEAICVWLGETPLVANGMVAPEYTEAKGQAEMNKEDIGITVDLQRGSVTETVWTSDLSHDYVRINAEYRT